MLDFVVIIAAVVTAGVAMYGCMADRFDRFIGWWMADYPIRTALARLMAAWKWPDR